MTTPKIKELRLRLGLTQSELGELVGVSDNRVVRRWEDQKEGYQAPQSVLRLVALIAWLMDEGRADELTFLSHSQIERIKQAWDARKQ